MNSIILFASTMSIGLSDQPLPNAPSPNPPVNAHPPSIGRDPRDFDKPSPREAERAYENAIAAAAELLAEHGEPRHLESLLQKHPKLLSHRHQGGKPDQYEGDSLLHFAVRSDWNHSKVEMLLVKGIDINVCGAEGTALHLAAQLGKTKAAEILLNNKAQVNAENFRGLTPLHYAAREGRLETVKFLIRYGARIDAKTKAFPEQRYIPPSSPVGGTSLIRPAIRSQTALEMAIENKRLEVAAYLKSLQP